MKTVIKMMEKMISKMNEELNSMKAAYWKQLHDWAMAQPDNNADEIKEAEEICRMYNLNYSLANLEDPYVAYEDIHFAEAVCSNIHDAYSREVYFDNCRYVVDITNNSISIWDDIGCLYCYIRTKGWKYGRVPEKDFYFNTVGRVVAKIVAELGNELHYLNEKYGDDSCDFHDWFEVEDYEDDNDFDFLNYDDCGFCEE